MTTTSTQTVIVSRDLGVRALVLAAVLSALLTPPQAIAQSSRVASASRTEKIDRLVRTVCSHSEQRSAQTCGKCIELSDMSVLFDAGATEAQVRDSLDSASDEQLDAFQPQGSTWTYTATDGTLFPGQAFTITYSFVPDGTAISTSWGSGDSDLEARVDASFPGGLAAFKTQFAEALNRWSELTNISYVEVSDDGAVWSSFGAPNIRGDVRIGMIPLGLPLAVNYYPQFGGDMVLDSNDMGTFANSLNSFRSLRNTVMHEHGHGLGMKHVMPTDGTKLMEPFLNTGFDGPQEDDIRAAHYLYGDWAEYNDEFTNNEFLDGTLRPVATAGVVTKEVEGVSLEREDSADWYGFGADLGTPIAIRLEPIGTTYEHGPQTDPPSGLTTVDAEAARDLGLRLYTRTSVSSEHIQLLAEIDFNAAGEAEYHPPIPYPNFGFGYMLIQVYAEDGVDDVQQYRLTISNAAIAASPDPEPAGAPVMSVFNVSAGQQIFDGTTVQFGAVTVGDAGSVSLTVINNGDATLNLGSPTLAGPGAGDYGVSLIQSTAAPNGGTAAIALGFSPQTEGVRQAVLTLPNNDPDQPNFSFILSGLGVAASEPVLEASSDGESIDSGDTLELGEVAVGAENQVALEITNTGNAALVVSDARVFATLTTAEVSLPDVFPFTLSPGQSETISIGITVTAEERQVARMRFHNNSAAGVFVVDVTANGIAAATEPADDCNANGIADTDEIADGTSSDCNENGIPDECEDDTDNDGVVDDCDRCADEDDLLDADGNGTPDCLEGEDDEDDDEEEDDDEDDEGKRNSFCGAGSTMPMMAAMLTMCGTGLRRRVRRSSKRSR